MKTKETGEPFFERWSRLKHESGEQPSPKPPEKVEGKAADAKSPPPELPPVDKLNIDSDYRAFFHPKVSEDTRRAALKKLFGDPRFNVMDGLDVYIDDYSKSDPIPPAMLAGLRQAQKILEWAKGEEKDAARERTQPDLAGGSQPDALESQAATAAPGPAPGRQAGDKVAAAAPDPAPGSRSSGNT